MSKETDLIKDRLDLVALISEYVTLKQAGQNFKGLCPFHQEKTPSFMVSPARGTWYCFGGCNEGGDAFSFVQKIEGLDFPATLKMLAERTGVVLPDRRSAQSSNRRARLFDVMTEAARFYHAVLLHQAGKKAQEYLHTRGITDKTIEEFQIGFAPMQWDALAQALSKKGFTIDEMVAVGLLGKNERGKTFDRFRGRIMFPVQDTQGRIVAFGGRIVPWEETGNEGKYVNSPETELYEKRRVVYNLNRAKQALRGGQACVVVEGYMDAVMLVQTGLQHVVASSGTAFTSDHIAQLSRFTKMLYFAFDGDAAGWKATVAATRAALAAGMDVSTVMLPDGKDPADVALETPEKVKEYFSQTRSLVLVLLEQLKVSGGQQEQLNALLPLIKIVANPIVQGKMIQDVATSLHVPEGRIHQLLTTAEAIVIEQASAPSFVPGSRPAALGEWQLLGLLLDQPAVRARIWPHLKEELFLEKQAQILYGVLQHMAVSVPDFATSSYQTLAGALPEGLISFAGGVVALGQELISISSEPADKEALVLLRGLQRRAISSRLALLQEELAFADEAGRSEALRQFQVLTQELSAITNS